MSETSEKLAPIQGRERGAMIPWGLHVRIWQAYASLGFGDQSAQRMAERGGFAWGEATWMLGEWNPITKRPFTDEQSARFAWFRGTGIESEGSRETDG